ncbi:tetratricopeptide repeat protein, partial [Amycolatopsis thailandensis]|uniref:tetratricopeptide repeat protein n=1 Tax=Amycolatopsis thailandensis TaxID=589330 RepID=UPI003634721C
LVTHNVIEAETVLDRVAVLERGRVIACDTPAGLKEQVAGEVRLGLVLHRRGELEEAERWYLKAAKRGDAAAMTNLGVLANDRNDPGEATAWYRKAAELGSVPAYTNLGRLAADHGNFQEAEHWFRAAADTGDQAGQRDLEELYRNSGVRHRPRS